MVDVPVTVLIPLVSIWNPPAWFMTYWGHRDFISLILMVSGISIGTEQVVIERRQALQLSLGYLVSDSEQV